MSTNLEISSESLSSTGVDPWIRARIVCPVDKAPLRDGKGHLECTKCSETYPVIHGVPILTPPQDQKGIDFAQYETDPFCGFGSKEERENGSASVDPYVQKAIAATNGIMYLHLIDKLDTYPIPNIQLPNGEGKTFLDIGCNWGRWSLAASRAGFTSLGIDPSLGAILAANRVSKALNLPARFIVGDGRCLPVRSGSFDQVFSYSVLQHFAREDVVRSLGEIRRVLVPAGKCLIQMANVYGLRSLYHQARRGFRKTKGFEVRYWSPSKLKKTWEREIGATQMTVDGFFCLNPQVTDTKLLPFQYKAVVHTSDWLRRMSKRIPLLLPIADSLYLDSRKAEKV